ncbi:MAG TPA: recombinase family protein [Herpetosiphonaceae bacterium]|nr:recombinase family protein [Herpetosiphonaceae bacterium]
MSNLQLTSSKVTTEHRAKRAYVYIRQSSPSQVTQHAESTDLQYRLVERALQLGWARDQISIIDEDLGKSGRSADLRSGFQHLIAEIGLARVGLVLSFDASRLARNNRDWYQLLDLCSLFGTLIADGEQLYDPRSYHDRLLLGLSGIMSEAELHQLKHRLHAGAYHKAERGELHLPLPVGLVRLPSGEVQLNPDEEVQARLRLIFQKFQELGTAKAVMRYLHQEGLPLPTRPLRGATPHEVIWQPARASAIRAILKNPAYAGAYVYGQHRHDPTHRKPGRPYSGTVRVPRDQWAVCLQNVYPAYISWTEFLANQERLRMNQSCYAEDKHGAPRQGQALLQGIVLCGQCGGRMYLRYSGPHGDFPVYVCRGNQSEFGGPRCQEVRALALDTEVERLLLEALAPDQVEIALAALDLLEEEERQLQRQWQLRLERARYEAERARRQYYAVDPENRLVARTLERQWEEKLRAVEQLEHEHQGWRQQHQLTVTPADREAMAALGTDLPTVWHAPSTTHVERKQIVQLVIKEVIVDQRRARGQVWFQINWQTGASSEHWLTRGVRSYDEYADLEEVQRRVRELNAAQKLDDEIAATLNAEGFCTARRRPFTSNMIWRLRKAWGIPSATINNGTAPNPPRWADGTYSVEGAAAAIGVFPGTIYQWLRRGRLVGQQLAKGLPWQISLTEAQIAELKAYVQRVRRLKKEAS